MEENTPHPVLNICICTYNRVGYLSRCLEKLMPQMRSSEVLISIIDNNSTDGTREYINGLQKKIAALQYIHEPNQGLSIARNTAWKNSKSDWIFYLDDDCLPSDNLLTAALSLIESNHGVDAFGGPIASVFEGEIPHWLPDGFGSFSMPYNSMQIIEHGFIRGGNFLIKRSVLTALDGFDPELGVSGNKLRYGEELQLQIRMRKQGYKIAYAPTLRTGHFVRTEKLTLAWVLHSEYARRRDKMLFEPISFWLATFQLLKTSVGRLFWIPIHLGEIIFSRPYPIKKALYRITQPMAYSLGEWIGVIKSKSKN